MQLAALHFVSFLAQIHRFVQKRSLIRDVDASYYLTMKIRSLNRGWDKWLVGCMTFSQCGSQAEELKQEVTAGLGRGQEDSNSSFTLEGEEKGERLNATTAFCPPEAVKLSRLDNSKLRLSLRFYDFVERRGTKREENNKYPPLPIHLKLSTSTYRLNVLKQYLKQSPPKKITIYMQQRNNICQRILLSCE